MGLPRTFEARKKKPTKDRHRARKKTAVRSLRAPYGDDAILLARIHFPTIAAGRVHREKVAKVLSGVGGKPADAHRWGWRSSSFSEDASALHVDTGATHQTEDLP